MILVEKERCLKFLKGEGILQELSDSIRESNIKIMGIPEREVRDEGAESVFKEIIAETFPSLEKELDIKDQKANRTPHYLNAQRPSPVLY